MAHYNPNQYFKHKYYLRHNELNELYVSYFIKLLGDSFIGGLTTVFLLSQGYSLRVVCLYFVLYFVMAFVTGFPARWMMKHWGVVKVLGLGICAFIMYYVLLRQVGSIPLFIIGSAYGIASGLYFSAFNIELAHALRKSKTEGMAVAITRIISVGVGIVGPLVGSIIATKASFQALLVFVSLVTFSSLIPLLISKDYKITLPRFSMKRIAKLGSPRLAIVLALRGGVEVGLDILWPAFIYLNYQNFITVGSILSATSLLMTIVIYVAGKYADLRQADSYKVGVLTHAPTWVVRLLLLSPGGLLVSSLLGSMTAYFIDIPFNKSIYHSANQSGAAGDFFIFVGSFTTLGRIGFLGLAALFPNLTIIFASLAIITLMHLVLLPELRPQTT